MLTQITVELAL